MTLILKWQKAGECKHLMNKNGWNQMCQVAFRGQCINIIQLSIMLGRSVGQWMSHLVVSCMFPVGMEWVPVFLAGRNGPRDTGIRTPGPWGRPPWTLAHSSSQQCTRQMVQWGPRWGSRSQGHRACTGWSWPDQSGYCMYRSDSWCLQTQYMKCKTCCIICTYPNFAPKNKKDKIYF